VLNLERLVSTTCTHEPHTHEPRAAWVLEGAAGLGAALGDAERLRLLELLLDGRHCVSELAEETAAGLSSVSQRLKILAAAGLVSRTREGRHVYYALADEHVRQILLQLFAHASEGGRP
jgi:DNA-binding transcriptional ArsR family regulator